MEDISSQQLTSKCNRDQVIPARRDKNILRTNLQLNRSIFNQIWNIQVIGNKLVILPTKPPKTDPIGGVVNISLRSEWYDSIFENDEE